MWKILTNVALIIQKLKVLKKSSAEPLLIWPFFLWRVLLGSIPLLTTTLCSHRSVLLDVFSLSAVGGLELTRWSLKILSNSKQPTKMVNNAHSFLFASISFLGWDFLFDCSTGRYLHCYKSHHLMALPSATLFTSISNEKQYVHYFGKRDCHCMCFFKRQYIHVNTYFSCLTHSQSFCCLLLYIVNLKNNAYVYADWKKMNA